MAKWKTPYKDLLPPLSTLERETLEADIKKNGVLTPIIVDEDGNILDGHNRYSIDKNAPHKTIASLSDAQKVAFVLRANLNRRNLSPAQKSELRERQKEVAKALREESPKYWTQARLAAELGVARNTISDWFSSNVGSDNASKPDARVSIPVVVHSEVVDRVASGETQSQVAADYGVSQKTISNIVRAEERKRENETKATKTVDAPSDKYDVVVIDPPWPIEKVERDCRPNQVKSLDYPTMEIDQLRELEIPARKDCHLWCWTTHRFLPDAFEIISDWGFRYVCTFVWHKSGGFQVAGLPQYNCEFVIYARKGSPKFASTKDFKVCFEGKRGRHSEKPTEFYQMVARVTQGKRLDMFNRRPIDGFDRWGNEA